MPRLHTSHVTASLFETRGWGGAGNDAPAHDRRLGTRLVANSPALPQR